MTKRLLILVMLCLSIVVFSIENEGSWVNASYDRYGPANYLDMVTVVKISNSQYIIQHTHYLEKERDYTVIAEKGVGGYLYFYNPYLDWNMVMDARPWGPNREVLEIWPDFDSEFVTQYVRVSPEYYEFLSSIDEWLAENGE